MNKNKTIYSIAVVLILVSSVQAGTFSSSEESMNGVKLSDSGLNVKVAVETFNNMNYKFFYFSYVPSSNGDYRFNVTKIIDTPESFRPVYSFNKKDWKFVSTSTIITGCTTGSTKCWIKFQIPSLQSGKKVYVSSLIPYTITDKNNFISRTSNNPYVKVQNIGYSVQDRTIEAITISDIQSNQSKKKLVFVAGQHAEYEATGAYKVEGIVGWLLANPSELSDKTFYFIPMVNPDGVYRGNSRSNYNNINLNRDWDTYSQPETKAVRNFLEKVCRPACEVGTDFHNFNSEERIELRGYDGASESSNDAYKLSMLSVLPTTNYVTGHIDGAFTTETYRDGFFKNSFTIEFSTKYGTNGGTYNIDNMKTAGKLIAQSQIKTLNILYPIVTPTPTPTYNSNQPKPYPLWETGDE